MYYNISFDLVAFVIFLILLLQQNWHNHRVTPAYYLYTLLLMDALLMTAMDILSAVMMEYSANVPLWSLYASNILFCLSQQGALPLYTAYVFKTADIPLSTQSRRLAMALPYAISAALMITTPLTHLIFHFENGVYQHGVLFPVLYVILSLYGVVLIYITARYRNQFGFRKLYISIFILVLMLVSAVIQYISDRLLVFNFGFSLGLVLIHYLILNPMMIFDSTKATRKSVMLDNMKHFFENKESFTLLTVHIINDEKLADHFGESEMDAILCDVRHYLKDFADSRIVYRIEKNAFAIRLHCPKEETEQIAQKINERMKDYWTLGDAHYFLHAYLGLIRCPEDVRTVSSLLDYITGLCSHDAQAGDIVCGSGFTEIEESVKILAAVKKAVLNKSFQVYYQPVYSVEQKRITAAEALIRLFDDEIGFVPPDKFIPIAEKEGYILRIGAFVFEEVCRFYSSHQLDQLGIEYIEVNLSAVQCMQYHLAEEFLEIMQQYGIAPERINLEITETSAILSSESLSSNIEIFSRNGVALSLDDYGTGYSNISYINEIPFSYIKVDKCILWSAADNPKAYVILKNTVEMAKRLHMKLIIEGVENKEHVRLLRALDCEYFQGYYFSKAVCGKDFLEYVTHFVLPEGCE